jgi:hypothetical protein
VPPDGAQQSAQPVGRGVEFGEGLREAEPAMMSAGLSGWVSMNAPGYTTANVADVSTRAKHFGGLAGWIRPSVRRNRQRPALDRNLDLLVRADGDGRRPLDRRRLDHHGPRSTGRGVHPTFDGSSTACSRRVCSPATATTTTTPQLVAERGAHQAAKACPITLSVVAMEVGKRLGVPIRGIGLPGHFVIRDKTSGTYADPFGGGVRYDEPGMIAAWQQRMGEGVRYGRHARCGHGTRHLIRMLNNLRHSLIERDQSVLLARMVPLRAAFRRAGR